MKPFSFIIPVGNNGHVYVTIFDESLEQAKDRILKGDFYLYSEKYRVTEAVYSNI